MEQWLLQNLASVGVGGVIAALVFYYYRMDAKRHEAYLENHIHADRDSRDKNTEALTRLSTIIEILSKRL